MGLIGVSGGVGATALTLEMSVKADDMPLHPPVSKWPHTGYLDSYDAASLRRGYQVYKQVCAACHSMRYISYRNMVDVMMTEEEAKKEAEEIMVLDGPDNEGNMFERPGKISDKFPSPFKNDEHASSANNGAVPPDLSYIVYARHGGEDYLYHLLNGYCDAPAGVLLDEGQHFNPYFMGGKIGMAPPLYDEVIEYEDGTPATQSQLAKDVICFLAWASSPEHDERKLMGLKALSITTFLLGISLYWKRYKFSALKTRKFIFTPKTYAPK